MLFAVICRDKPGHLEVRKANRSAHLDHLAKQGEAVRLAGPLLDAGAEAPVGSLILFEAPDLAAAEAFAAADPYAMAGLFESVQVHPFRQVLPAG